MSTITRPTVAYRCIVWHGNIQPEFRNSTTLSDGAIFSAAEDASAFCRRVAGEGGKVHSVRMIKNPTHWYDSLAEYDRLGSMTAAELAELQAKWRGC